MDETQPNRRLAEGEADLIDDVARMLESIAGRFEHVASRYEDEMTEDARMAIMREVRRVIAHAARGVDRADAIREGRTV